MEVKGKIIVVQPLQSGEGKNGTWKKQEYVIEYEQNSQYPRKMMFNLWGDKIDQYNIQEGQTLNVGFDIDCREYNGRWYNDIRAWKIDVIPAEEVGGTTTPSAPPSFTPMNSGDTPSDDTSDLPF
ncbi:MAG: DUF3127 domain-containing protein [Tannerella sp.]|jgi:hypothetical protein|nr:DUF3127 domain-containing protein [Tannerella sp.]